MEFVRYGAEDADTFLEQGLKTVLEAMKRNVWRP